MVNAPEDPEGRFDSIRQATAETKRAQVEAAFGKRKKSKLEGESFSTVMRPEFEGDARSQAGGAQGRSHTKAGSGSATDKPLAERRSEVLIDSSGIEAGPSVLDPETETFGVHDPGTTKYEGDVEATSNEEEK